MIKGLVPFSATFLLSAFFFPRNFITKDELDDRDTFSAASSNASNASSSLCSSYIKPTKQKSK